MTEQRFNDLLLDCPGVVYGRPPGFCGYKGSIHVGLTSVALAVLFLHEQGVTIGETGRSGFDKNAVYLQIEED